MSNLIKATNFDFMGKRRLSVGIFRSRNSRVGVVLPCGAKRTSASICKGGDLLVLEGQKKVDEGDVRAALKQIDLEESVVQTRKSSGKEFLTFAAPRARAIESRNCSTKIPQAKFRVEQNDKVGKLVGDELARNSLIALGLGIIGIFIYVTARLSSPLLWPRSLPCCMT